MSQLSDVLSMQAEVLDLSGRQIADKARDSGYTLSNKTASQYLNGKHGKPDPATLRAFAEVLRLDERMLRTVANLPVDYGEYDPPDFAREMTLEQRRVVDETIRLFVKGNASQTQMKEES